MPVAAMIHRRDNEDVGHLRDFFVFLNQLGDVVQFAAVEIFAALGLDGRFGRTGHGGDVGFQLVIEILRSFQLRAVLQPLIKNETVPQIQDRALISRALDRFQLVGLIALFLDLFQERREFGEAEIFSLTLLPAEQAEHFVILDNKDRILISRRRIEKNIGLPLNRAQSTAAFKSKLLFTMYDEQ